MEYSAPPPIHHKPKNAPVLVPVGALPKVSAIRKEMGKRPTSTTSVYEKKLTKGVGKMAATGANAIPITKEKVDVGKNNNFDKVEEEDGKEEYSASDVTFVSKSEKSIVKFSSNVKVKSNQPADADGLYSDSDDDNEEEDAELQQNEVEEEEGIIDEEEKDEDEEVNDWENDDDYGWDEKKEDDYKDEMAANDGWLKNAKMGGGQTAAAEKKSVIYKKPASSQMEQKQLEDGIKQQGKTITSAAVMKKPTLTKPSPAVIEKKKPAASANKFALQDKSALEASADEIEEAANEANGTIEIVPEAPKAVVKNGNVMSALATNSVERNTTPRIPTPASLTTTETMSPPMPDSFKYQMLAIITTLVHIHRIYKVTDLHEMLSKVDGYKLEYAIYLPTSDALVQFVQRHCDAIKLHKFDVAKDQAFFVLDASRVEQLEYLHCKIGKSLEAASGNK